MTPAHSTCTLPLCGSPALPRQARRSGCAHGPAPLVLAVLAVLVCLTGCGRPSGRPAHPVPVPPGAMAKGARVLRIKAVAELLEGPPAAAQPGDFRLENPQVAILVQGLGRPHAGAVVDAGRRSRSVDALGEISLQLGGARARAARYTRVEAGMEGEEAVLKLHGHDPEHPRVSIITEYRLGPQEPTLEIVTTLTNGGRRSVDTTISHQLDLGLAAPFAPGLGLFPEGRHQLAWLTAGAAGVSYGYFAASGKLPLQLAGSMVTDRLGAAKLKPGGQLTGRRILAVGGGGLGAAVLGPILRGRGLSPARLTVALTSALGDPIPGAAVLIKTKDKPFCMARTFPDGVVPLELPPGAYAIGAMPGDRLAPPKRVMVRSGQAQVIRLTAGPPSRLVYEVREQDKPPPFPAMLTIAGLDNTPTPWLGPHRTFKRYSVFLSPSGQGSLPLPPGQYRVTASHGAGYTSYSENITLHPESGGSLVARLQRVVNHEGYLAVDPGQLSQSSPGCTMPSAQRELLSRVEGLDAALVLTPENEALARKKSPKRMPPSTSAGTPHAVLFSTWNGFTSSTPELGQVSIIPRVEGAHLPRLLRRPGEALVVLEPGSKTGGLIQRLGLDLERPEVKKIPAILSAVNLLSVNRAARFEALLIDWLALLNAGRQLIAVGASGCSMSTFETAGPARTYIKVPDHKGPAPRELVYEALTKGQAVVSNGPFLRLSIQDKGPGETITMVRSRRRRGKAIKLTVHATVSGPGRQHLESLTIYFNGEIITTPTPIASAPDGVQLDKKIVVPVARDGYIVALVKGPTSSNPRAPLPPLALTNPIWIDFDGDGKIAPVVQDKRVGAAGR